MDKEVNNNNVDATELTQDTDAQNIINRMNGEPEDNSGDIELPSDGMDDGADNAGEEGEQKLYSNKYKTIDDLKKGIKSIGSTLPDAVIDGMNDTALEEYYNTLSKDFSTKDKRKNAIDDNKKEEPKKDEQGKPEVVSQEMWDELSKTFNEKNGITNEQYDKLSKMGIPESIVDNYLDGLKAKQEKFTNDVYAMAGGKEQYEVVKSWAEENLEESEIVYISSLSGDAMLSALKGVKARYDVANAGTVRLEGSTRGNTGMAYKNQDEYLADVKDKRYSYDKNYRAKVEEKLRRSKL